MASSDNGVWAAGLRRMAPVVAVLALWALGAWHIVTWLRLDNTPPPWDSAWHLGYGLVYGAYLDRLSLVDAWAGLGATSTYYPPFVHFCAALCWRLCGTVQSAWPGLSTADLGTLANLFFLALLLGGTYALGARCYGRRAGVLAAFLALCYPVLAAHSRLFLLDFPLTGLMAATLAVLAASRGLTNKVWIWPLGMLASAAMWTKWSFATLFLAPFAMALAEGVRRFRAGDDPELTRQRLGFNIAVVLAGMFLLAGPWYLSHFRQTLAQLHQSDQTWLKDLDPVWYSPAGLTYYLRALCANQLFAPFTLLGLFGAWYAWAHRDWLPGSGFLLGTLVAGLALLTLVPNKDPRFSMPLLPVLAVLSSSWLAPPPAGLRPRAGWVRVQRRLLAAVLALGLLEFQAVAYGLPWRLERVGPQWAPLVGTEPHLARRPATRAWPHEALAADLARLAPAGGTIGVVPNRADVNLLTLRYYVFRHLLPYLPNDPRLPRVVTPFPTVGGRQRAASVDSLVGDQVDVLVLLDGPQGTDCALADQTMQAIHDDWQRFVACYELAASHPLPDGLWLRVYRRVADAPPVLAEDDTGAAAAEAADTE
jgi:4-amino-4-deoxy-L-arabinose transferase-like glycosyltransferase